MTLSKSLTEHPSYFTPEELKWLDSSTSEEMIPKTALDAFKQAWFDYKVGYSDANPADTLTKEEIEALTVFCKENGIGDKFASELQKLWPEYKKTLAANLSVPVSIPLTEKELKALESFIASWGLKEHLEAIKTDWMLYKGSFTTNEKQEKLTEEQLALINDMVIKYGLDPKLAGELEMKLLEYNNSYIEKMKSTALTDEELKSLESFVGEWNLKNQFEAIQAEWVEYKRVFILSEQVPAKELNDEEVAMITDFIARYSLDSKLSEELCRRWMEYRLKLAGLM